MNLAIAATVFGFVVPAELPDKTFVASLVMGSRFAAPMHSVTGVPADSVMPPSAAFYPFMLRRAKAPRWSSAVKRQSPSLSP